MAYNEDSSASGHDEPWIQWFCGLKGHEMFCEVERSYIEDGFNLYGLRAFVTNFSDCLDLILDRIGPDDSDDSHLTQSACTLYGLIHARYIITAHGLDAMYNKYAAKEFGTCPLVQCQGQPVLPVGLRDEVGYDSVKVFCPKCQCVYHPPPPRRGGSGTVDGASFGTTFAHLFLMTFSNLVPDGLPADSAYVPRVFGFRVHHSARQRPERGGASQMPPGGTASVSTNSRGSRNSTAVVAAAAAIAPMAAASAVAPTSSVASAVPVPVDGTKRHPTKGNGLQTNDGGDRKQQTGAASSTFTAQGTGLTAAQALESLNYGSKKGGDAGESATQDGFKNRCDDGGGGQAINPSADGEDGKGQILQAKRKPRGSSSVPSTQADNNGSVESSLAKQSKRQKRPSNGIGT